MAARWRKPGWGSGNPAPLIISFLARIGKPIGSGPELPPGSWPVPRLLPVTVLPYPGWIG